MLIYEKDNKLNINFNDKVNEQPDLQIGKSGDKTQISVNGQSFGGGSFVIHMNETTMDNGTKYELDKTWQEIRNAIEAGMYCCIVGYFPSEVGSDEMIPLQLVVKSVSISEESFGLEILSGGLLNFNTDTKDGYPYAIISSDPG